MRGWAAALLTVSLVAAGCLGSQLEEGPGATPNMRGTLPSGPPSQADLADRTLQEPPTLRLGEWWDVRVDSELTGEVYEGRVVVAGMSQERYLVGMPTDAFAHGLLILHLPGIGPVTSDTFGYEAHDVLFEPTDFPLTEGKTWTTEWYTGGMDAEVVEVNDGQARIEMVGENTRMNLTYDPAKGIPNLVEVDGYGTLEVLDHGFGHEGQVTVPWEHDLVFLHGRLAGAADLGLQPAAPVETITVEGGYDRASFALLLGNVLAEGPPGVYRVQATAPDGTTYEEVFTAGPQDDLLLAIKTHDDPVGDWELEYEAGGPGAAAIEGVAYQVIEVDLPGGQVVTGGDALTG